MRVVIMISFHSKGEAMFQMKFVLTSIIQIVLQPLVFNNNVK